VVLEDSGITMDRNEATDGVEADMVEEGTVVDMAADTAVDMAADTEVVMVVDYMEAEVTEDTEVVMAVAEEVAGDGGDVDGASQAWR